MPPEAVKAAGPIKAIQDAIRDNMYNSEDPSEASKMFICEHNLDLAWRDHNLSSIFSPTKFKDEERATIKERFIRVLSILILIGWAEDDLLDKFRGKFRSLFLRAGGREDKDLPLAQESLSFLETSSWVFWQQQFAFCPAIIEESENSYIQTIEEHRRLPFSGKPVQMGDGAYGDVAKVEIAPRCLRHIEKNTENFRSTFVACKTYKNERSAESFFRESQNLDILKEGFKGSRRVMQHIASIIHGNKFMILLPLAEHYDLEIFLRGGRKPEADTVRSLVMYDFEETFPHLAPANVLQGALLKELFEIAAALVWLHEELHVAGNLDRYLAHLDLKPENILLVRDTHAHASKPHHPAGKWMLTDFGVSVFDKDTNAKASGVHSIRDVGPRLTSRENGDQIMRGHGPYEPPEVDLDNVDGRKCGVWSFACILCDVLAFAHGRHKDLLKFRKLRYDGKDDYFYRARGSSADRARMINSSNTELKSEVKDWFENLAQNSAQNSTNSWVPGYVRILQKALLPTPHERLDMRDIMKMLDELRSIQSRTGTSPPHNHQYHIITPQSQKSSSSFTSHLGSRSSKEIAASPASSAMPTSIVLRPPTSELPEMPEVQGQSSSGIKVREQRPVNVVRSYDHPPLSRRVSSSAFLVPSPVAEPYAKPASYEPMPKITIPSFKKVSVNIMAITPDGEKVAFVCGSELHVFWTESGSKAATIDNLPQQVSWTKMFVTDKFVFLYGMKSRDKIIQVHNFDGISEPKTIPITCHDPITDQDEQASNILLSRQNVAACVYRRRIRLFYLADNHDEDFRIRRGSLVNQACFSGSGDLLYLWVSGESANHAYIYDIRDRPVTLQGEGLYVRAATESKNLTLWPYESLPACVVHEGNGTTFIMQRFSQPPSDPPRQTRQYTGMPSVLLACVARNDALICVEKGRIMGSERHILEHQLSERPDKLLSITRNEQKLGSVERSVDDKSKAAVRLRDGQLTLVLCTIKGDILRYSRKY